MADVDELALALPEAEKTLRDGRPAYSIRGDKFCWHRAPRPDVREDVLVFWVESLEEKDLLIGDARGLFFTTAHWNGYRAVLMRFPDLVRIDLDELEDMVAGAWLARAPKRLANAWLAGR